MSKNPPLADPEQLNYVFIVAYGRSGSTLLQAILQSIDGYHIRGENNNLILPLYHSVRRLKTAQHKHQHRNPSEPKTPWYGLNDMSVHNYTSGLIDVYKREVIQAPQGTRVAGFKEVRYHDMPDSDTLELFAFMIEYFQNAKFVFNTRNWKSISKSAWWSTLNPEQVKKKIQSYDALYQKFVEENPSRGHIVSFDDYVRDPAALKPLFAFLGENYDEEALVQVLGERLTH